MGNGGLLVLVAYGSQNILLSGNPQMTYYYKIFKRYSHFSMENIEVALDGPNQLQWDKPVQIRAKIPRNGDLLSDIYFSFNVPSIFSKYAAQRNGDPNPQYEFQWVNYLGAAIINKAAFFVGGQKIQEFDGTYLLAKAQLEYDTDTFAKWKILVGETNETVNPALGAYSGSLRTTYPTVIRDPINFSAGAAQLNRPSIVAQDIHVPLLFWFSDATSQALPLVGLQSQECEVQLTLNPIQQLYTILDPSGNRVNPTYRMRAPAVEIQNNKPFYGPTEDVSGAFRSFLVDIGSATPELNTWNYNPRLQCTYVYLSQEEQTTFATRPLSYVLPQVMTVPFPGLFTSRILDLDIHNPITRLIFVPRRSDWIYRNDFANFTNWYTYPFAPIRPPLGQSASFPSGVTPTYLTGSSSGLLIPNSQKDIIQSIRVLVDGTEVQQVKPIDFFTKINPFRYTTGFTNAELPFYTWAITSSKTQPSGSLNASRIRNLQVELGLFPLPVNTTYTYDVMVYAECLNFFIVASGSGALKYAL
jgi:hypothetical protein